jgi:sialic acid synthase SpsE
MDVNNFSLLSYVARKQKPILLSTGMATLAEIKSAVKVIEAENNRQVIILHCVSLYPPKYKNVHLNNIVMLRKEFCYPVGFSDHTFGIDVALAAIALGACVIEKHFTIDKNLPGWDHEISADAEELRFIVTGSRHISEALGDYRRIISDEEKIKKDKFRRSLVAARDLKAGWELKETDLNAKRPGTGIPPNEIQSVIGRALKKDVQYDQVIFWDDLS